MQKKFLVLCLIILLFLLFFSNANAQTATPAANRLKDQMQILKDQKKTAVSQIKEETKLMIAAKRDEFKARMQIIKDEKKKMLIERIDAKLFAVNKKHTARFSEVLDRIQRFLDKIKQSTTDTKILDDAAAQTVIDTAKAAVEAQAAKTYTMSITDDSTLKLNAGTTVSQLRQDLMAVHKLVIDAKQAVQTLRGNNVMIERKATSSAKL